MFCSHCGNKCIEHANFCGKCGTSMNKIGVFQDQGTSIQTNSISSNYSRQTQTSNPLRIKILFAILAVFMVVMIDAIVIVNFIDLRGSHYPLIFIAMLSGTLLTGIFSFLFKKSTK